MCLSLSHPSSTQRHVETHTQCVHPPVSRTDTHIQYRYPADTYIHSAHTQQTCTSNEPIVNMHFQQMHLTGLQFNVSVFNMHIQSMYPADINTNTLNYKPSPHTFLTHVLPCMPNTHRHSTYMYLTNTSNTI